MSCAFDLDHDRELLDAAKAGGYTFAFFDHDPRPGDLFLRHDVDLSLAGALKLAELEAEAARNGSRKVRLETNESLTEAIALYRSSGYMEVEPFNDEPYAHHWFEKRLTEKG